MYNLISENDRSKNLPQAYGHHLFEKPLIECFFFLLNRAKDLLR